MKAKTIAKHIAESDLTKDEIDELWSLLRQKSSMLSQKKAMLFGTGDFVKFTGRGRLVIGMVIKRNRRTISVLSRDGVNWKVSPELLETATQKEYNDAAALHGQGHNLREAGGV